MPNLLILTHSLHRGFLRLRAFIRTPQSGHSSLFGYFVLALNPSITSRFSELARFLRV